MISPWEESYRFFPYVLTIGRDFSGRYVSVRWDFVSVKELLRVEL